MTPFSFEHVFPGVAPKDLLRAFSHPGHQAAQDAANDVERRDIIERIDEATRYRCDSWVFPRRQLPAFIRPFVKKGLELHEIVTWDKATDALEIEMLPAIMGGRSRILITCRVVADPAGARRIYAGSVSVEAPLIGGRIEKTIVGEMGTSLDVAQRTTLRWLAEGGLAERAP